MEYSSFAGRGWLKAEEEIDRHGRLPHPVQNLLSIARIKPEAASNNISSVEVSQQPFFSRPPVFAKASTGRPV